MTEFTITRRSALIAGAILPFSASLASASGKTYDTGASDTEVKFGNTFPYSGPASAYGVMGLTQVAYYKMINDRGGVNGRKLNFLTYDDGFNPAKTVEQTRKLVESDNVLFIANQFGTPTSTAVQRYLNGRKIPQLFLASGASKFNDPEKYPWTMGFQPDSVNEARIFIEYIKKEKPDAKIGILYQNDDFGKDYVHGTKLALGDAYKKYVVAEAGYDVTDPTVDSQVLKLRASGADVLLSFVQPKFGAQAIKKMAELGWKPMHLICTAAASPAMTMRPAGIENSQGIIAIQYHMNQDDPTWKDTKDIKEWRAFMETYMPGADMGNNGHMYGYVVAQAVHKVIEAAGDNLTRQNILEQARNLRNVHVNGLIPGILLNNSPTDYAPLRQMQLTRFKGDGYELFGDVLSVR